jgi:RNA polymerase sigma-70 factor (ECF subfamily)
VALGLVIGVAHGRNELVLRASVAEFVAALLVALAPAVTTRGDLLRHTRPGGGQVQGMSNPSRTPDSEPIFESLYEAVYADLLRFVQRRAHPDHAEDVVADAFLVAWRRIDELPKHREDARAWLFGIARNVLLNDHRGAERRRTLGVRLSEATTVSQTFSYTHQDADLVVRRVDLARAWSRLSEVHQEALGLTVFEELRAPQAAAVLGISSVAFRLRLSRARRALRLHLDHLPQPSGTLAGTSERITES